MFFRQPSIFAAGRGARINERIDGLTSLFLARCYPVTQFRYSSRRGLRTRRASSLREDCPCRMRTRRELFSDVGRGMIAAAVGTEPRRRSRLRLRARPTRPATSPSATSNRSSRSCRKRPPDKLLPKVAEKLKSGTELKTFVAAAAPGQRPRVRRRGLRRLPHAHGPRPGVQDGEGGDRSPSDSRSRCMKVLVPQQHPPPGSRRHEGRSAEAGRSPASSTSDRTRGEQLRDAARKADMAAAEATFAAICKNGKPEDALNATARRGGRRDRGSPRRARVAGVGPDQLRRRRAGPHDAPPVGPLLREGRGEREPGEVQPAASRTAAEAARPAQADRARSPARRSADDAWVEKFADTIFASTAGSRPPMRSPRRWPRASSAEAIGEAISLAANQLVLRDQGRPKEWTSAEQAGRQRPRRLGRRALRATRSTPGGTSSRAGDRRTQVTSLILAGYQVARDRGNRTEFQRGGVDQLVGDRRCRPPRACRRGRGTGPRRRPRRSRSGG